MCALQKMIIFIFALSTQVSFANSTQNINARFVTGFDNQVPLKADFGNKKQIEVELIRDLGFIFVEAFINSQGPFRFLVDTGSDTSILTREVVEKLHIQPIKTHKKIFQTGNKKAEIDTSLYDVEQFAMGDLTFKQVPFIASDTASDDFLILKELNITGVIGANLFYDIVLTLDLSKKKMLFSETQETIDTLKNIIRFHDEHFLPIIKTTVVNPEESINYDFLIDTGYTGFVQMPVCFSFESQHDKSITSYDIFKESNTGFLSELHGTWMIGTNKIENPIVKYLMGTCEKPLKWGLIGTRFLEHHVVTIDQHKREVTLN